ncbi:MAG TPA: AMP-binding protein [Pirellulales bacterium]|nr:AMP-binding protein [Pirellulales bacterium]
MNFAQRRACESREPADRRAAQLAALNRLLEKILPHNHFYAEKLGEALTRSSGSPSGPLHSLDDLNQLPFTFKDELLNPRHSGDLAANLTFAPDRYARYHQTSGTRGRPIVVLDTREDWQWWMDCWQFVLDAADINPGDTVFMAFSFGPFVGFWSAFDAAVERGCLVVPGGGLASLARVELIRRSRATAVFCTPSYALHLAEVAAEHKLILADLPIRTVIVAGEPGGSISSVRSRIEQAWQARVLDHAGATEIGPWGYGDERGEGLYVNEHDFVAEFVAVDSGTAAREGELAELVLTNLGRVGCPLVRYRTGDLVRPRWSRGGENRFVFLEGGVLGRVDDMMIVRGVNIFPSSIEQILRSFPEVIEYRMTVSKIKEMDELVIEIEDRLNDPDRVGTELAVRLGLKIEVRAVSLGSLPRGDGKASRFVDKRCTPTSNH